MLGSAFRGTLREAQAGDEQAFTRLWRDANPLVVRYLRVIGADDPSDAAREGWRTAVRGLTGYSGDEVGWRVWLLACARLRAEQEPGHHSWATVTSIERQALSSASRASAAASAATAAAAATMSLRGQVAEGVDINALLDPTPDPDPEHRGLADTITALRALPLGQGEILALRLGAGLPVGSVSDVVGTDADTVRRSEKRALERLGTEAELITWSLDAPASTAELADERVALAAFRSIPRPPAWSVPRTRVVTVGNAPAGQRGARRTRGIANAAGRSRTALLGIAMLSASAMSLGGLSAAAYIGALPTGVQRLMHEAIGAPEPTATRVGAPKGAAGRSTAPTRPAATGASGVRVGAASGSTSGAASGVTSGATSGTASAAATGGATQCRDWAADQRAGTSPDASAAFTTLAAIVGGPGKVDSYCARVAPPPTPTTSAAPTSSPTATGEEPTGTPTGSSTGAAPPQVTASPPPATDTPATTSPQTDPPSGSTTQSPTGSPAPAGDATPAPGSEPGSQSGSGSGSGSGATSAPQPVSTADVTAPVG